MAAVQLPVISLEQLPGESSQLDRDLVSEKRGQMFQRTKCPSLQLAIQED